MTHESGCMSVNMVKFSSDRLGQRYWIRIHQGQEGESDISSQNHKLLNITHLINIKFIPYEPSTLPTQT
jgi:hypothetical protein